MTDLPKKPLKNRAALVNSAFSKITGCFISRFELA